MPLAFCAAGFSKQQKVDIGSADLANFGAMPIQLALQPRDGYLRFEVTGMRIRGEFAREMLGVWQRVADECQAGGFSKALGISNVSGPVPLVELFEVGERTPQILARAGCRRVAYVVLGDKEALDALKFGEDVAVNRGQIAKVFADESTAIAWLMEP